VAVAAVRRAAAAAPAAAPWVAPPRRPRAVGRGGTCACSTLNVQQGFSREGAANFDAVRGVLWDLHVSRCALSVLYCLY